jgi:nucleotide-binding universal stress UspA family protein
VNGFPEKVLLATDGLENSTLAGRAAVDLAKKGGAELHVVHAWHTVPSPHFDSVIRSGLEDVGREVLEEQVRSSSRPKRSARDSWSSAAEDWDGSDAWFWAASPWD